MGSVGEGRMGPPGLSQEGRQSLRLIAFNNPTSFREQAKARIFKNKCAELFEAHFSIHL